MGYQKTNLNDTIKFKLTEKGKKILKEYKIGDMPWDLTDHVRIDKDGYSTMQLWDFAHTFGPHLYNGGEVPVETAVEVYVE